MQNLAVGDRVMILGQNLLSTTTIVCAKQCVKIPDTLSLEDAASIPFAFATALHGLIKLGRLQKDDTVLIHNATDSVGLAAIQICKEIGSKVSPFETCKSYTN